MTRLRDQVTAATVELVLLDDDVPPVCELVNPDGERPTGAVPSRVDCRVRWAGHGVEAARVDSPRPNATVCTHDVHRSPAVAADCREAPQV